MMMMMMMMMILVTCKARHLQNRKVEVFDTNIFANTNNNSPICYWGNQMIQPNKTRRNGNVFSSTNKTR